ncbi:hypothetical protein JCM8202_001732 [Rhodotorula sphaerocarpa]
MAADNEYDDLYGDLYPAENETPASAAPTDAASTAAPAGDSSAAAPAAASNSLSPGGAQGSGPATGYVDPSRPAQLPRIPTASAMGPALHMHDVGVPRPQALQANALASRTADQLDEGKMFIGGLNWDTTDDTLKMYFEQFGEVTHCTIMRDAESGRSRGFGFLTFKEPSSVNAVMAREHHLDGKNIDPKRAIPRSDTAKTDKLFVRALPPSCTQESFRSFWRQFGIITDATLMMDKETGRHRGFGFVNYERREDVDKVLQSGPHYMDGQMLEVKRAQAKGEPRRPDYGVNTNTGSSYAPPPPMGGGGMGMGMGMGMGGGGMGGFGAGPMGGGAPAPGTPFDPAAMSKFFSQMGWGGWNPQMMMGNPMMMGSPMMGGMGNFGGPMGMPGMGGSPGGASGAGAGDESSSAGGGGGVGTSQWTAPMAQPMGMQGGRGGPGGMRGGRGGPPTGPAAMRDGPGGGGAGPQRNRGGGSGYHPYSR